MGKIIEFKQRKEFDDSSNFKKISLQDDYRKAYEDDLKFLGVMLEVVSTRMYSVGYKKGFDDAIKDK